MTQERNFVKKWDWKTYIFMDEESNEYCPTHNFKRYRFVSKLGEATISKGYLCVTCEMQLMEYQSIILRKDNKWIPIKDYLKQQRIISYAI